MDNAPLVITFWLCRAMFLSVIFVALIRITIAFAKYKSLIFKKIYIDSIIYIILACNIQKLIYFMLDPYFTYSVMDYRYHAFYIIIVQPFSLLNLCLLSFYYRQAFALKDPLNKMLKYKWIFILIVCTVTLTSVVLTLLSLLSLGTLLITNQYFLTIFAILVSILYVFTLVQLFVYYIKIPDIKTIVCTCFILLGLFIVVAGYIIRLPPVTMYLPPTLTIQVIQCLSWYGGNWIIDCAMLVILGSFYGAKRYIKSDSKKKSKKKSSINSENGDTKHTKDESTSSEEMKGMRQSPEKQESKGKSSEEQETNQDSSEV